jgi:hypothetical protein
MLFARLCSIPHVDREVTSSEMSLCINKLITTISLALIPSVVDLCPVQIESFLRRSLNREESANSKNQSPTCFGNTSINTEKVPAYFALHGYVSQQNEAITGDKPDTRSRHFLERIYCIRYHAIHNVLIPKTSV